MKKLVIDARMIGAVGHGIAKYVEGIALHFHAQDALTQDLLQAMQVSSLSEVEIIFFIRPECPPDSPVRKFKTIELDLSCFDPRSWFLIPRKLRELKAELFFNPTFASYPSLPVPFVQTVHDLNHLHYGNFAHHFYYSLLLKRSITQAKLLLTVSESVKRELVDWAGISPEKVKVFYNQFELPLRYTLGQVDEVLQKYKLQPKRYFLCTTNSKPHKNLSFLVQAYAAYRTHQTAANLKMVQWKNEFDKNQKEVHAPDKLPLVITVNQEELPANSPVGVMALGGVNTYTLNILYQECAGFYFPSLYEGFGRPPVEAALAGVNCIVVSDLPVHHEAETLAKTKFRFVEV